MWVTYSTSFNTYHNTEENGKEIKAQIDSPKDPEHQVLDQDSYPVPSESSRPCWHID